MKIRLRWNLHRPMLPEDKVSCPAQRRGDSAGVDANGTWHVFVGET